MKDIKTEIARIIAEQAGLAEEEALALIEIPPESSKGEGGKRKREPSPTWVVATGVLWAVERLEHTRE